MQSLSQLQTEFNVDGVRFENGPDDVIFIQVSTPQATAQVSLYGAQIMSYQPTGAEHDMLFMSPMSRYGVGNSIRGGVPICWPWFGNDPNGTGRPAHGFARNNFWQLEAVETLDDGAVRLYMSLPDILGHRDMWHSDCSLNAEITIGEKLQIQLTTHNHDDESFVISQALHTYFRIGDISDIHIRGLDDFHYLDKTDDFDQKLQQGDIRFDCETDRIYLHSPEQLFIEDEQMHRRVVVESHGSETTVVWNPWTKADDIHDLREDAYRSFVCVETANAADDSIELAPGESHTLLAEYRLMPIE